MRKIIIKYSKKSGNIFYIILCFSILTGCEYFMNKNEEPDQGVSITTNASGEKLISIPISLGGAFSTEHTIQLTMKDLVETGKVIIFGTDDPQGKFASGNAAIGKGQCPLCHKFFNTNRGRGPSMMPGQTTDPSRLNQILLLTPDPALAFSIEARSHQRIKEERYQIAMKRHAKGEKNSGIKPHAKTGGEYLIESLYCPNCYVVLGWGLKGTNDSLSVEPISNKPPIALTDLEIIAVIAYVQSNETPGDYSKVTVLQDWENYFGQKLTLALDPPKIKIPVQ